MRPLIPMQRLSSFAACICRNSRNVSVVFWYEEGIGNKSDAPRNTPKSRPFIAHTKPPNERFNAIDNANIDMRLHYAALHVLALKSSNDFASVNSTCLNKHKCN